MLISSIRNDNPIIFLEHKMLYNMKGEVPEDSYELPLFKADIKQPGSDVTVVAYSRMLHFALEAAQNLAEEGISVEVIDPRTIYPIDKETIINSVAKTGRLVILQEAPKTMGYAAEISAIMAEEVFEYLRAPIKRVAALDVPVAFAPVLEDYVMPKVDDVIKAVKEIIEY